LKKQMTLATNKTKPAAATITAEAPAKPTKAPKPVKEGPSLQDLLAVKGVLEGALMDASKRGAVGEIDLLKRFSIMVIRKLRPFEVREVRYVEKKA
jgi:hypothetical protein